MRGGGSCNCCATIRLHIQIHVRIRLTSGKGSSRSALVVGVTISPTYWTYVICNSMISDTMVSQLFTYSLSTVVSPLSIGFDRCVHQTDYIVALVIASKDSGWLKYEGA